jgi:excisionase family DNA binding protein
MMHDDHDHLIGYARASARLGLPTSTLRDLVRRGKIPHVRLGPRLVRFAPAALDSWVRERTVGAAPAPPVGGLMIDEIEALFSEAITRCADRVRDLVEAGDLRGAADSLCDVIRDASTLPSVEASDEYWLHVADAVTERIGVERMRQLAEAILVDCVRDMRRADLTAEQRAEIERGIRALYVRLPPAVTA